MSEEAEERLMRYFLLTHLCGISHRIWRCFLTIRTKCRIELSQYTLRYRYVTGSWLRPDTRKNPLTRPDGLVCSRHPLTGKL
ncbi:hypothetical protein E5L95_24700 [Salmonella enterica subsp. enterica serovar Typhimurium]|nr:hypothetical protein [Salmonella enterica subsp. enterica serovar Typhimurium]EBA1382787.1 hypothetical protein [Salmonella enterica subsp. enterica serovar Typhimurium]ECS4662900.1 hypothetical protein [Salmonella enterica subsp. enterica serovar Typhimurium]ORG20136.1 hypothetical protein B5002_10120 [Salmonella enterica subsp. enterica serovar Typhimurium]ORG30399.1 hypothetical protein B5000_20290 [Salmonella enterica subsp. enterica serovar Typhimurium]